MIAPLVQENRKAPPETIMLPAGLLSMIMRRFPAASGNPWIGFPTLEPSPGRFKLPS